MKSPVSSIVIYMFHNDIEPKLHDNRRIGLLVYKSLHMFEMHKSIRNYGYKYWVIFE